MTLNDTSSPIPLMSQNYNKQNNTMSKNHPKSSTFKGPRGLVYEDGVAAEYYYTRGYCTPPRSHPSHHYYHGYEHQKAGSRYAAPHPYDYHHTHYWQPTVHPEEMYITPSYGSPPTSSRPHLPPSSTFYSTPEPSTWLPADFVPPRGSSPANVTPTRPDTSTTQKKETPAGNNKDSSLIWDLQDTDIVCGRGAPVNWQRGNHFFRDLIEEYQTVYLCSKRCDKPKIATEVTEAIQSRGGRFVRRVKASYGGRFGWEEIHEKRAYEKVCQALREGAPELRRKMLASSNHLQSQAHTPTRGREDKENRTPGIVARV